jgi:uncharacterized protein with NRDE domain
MCLAFVALDAHREFALVLAANRDEAYARGTDPAHWWEEGILAGRDRVAGGTWLGVTRQGRWSLVTNVRDAGLKDPDAPSRGAMVRAALEDSRSPLMVAAAATLPSRHNGFNLLVGDRRGGAYASNRASGALVLQTGIHGLSNHVLDSPWPKVEHGKRAFASWVAAGDTDIATLLDLLRDDREAPDASLPRTGVSLEWERRLSSAFIVSAEYGTRCSTVVTVSRAGHVRFVERNFAPGGEAQPDIVHEFDISN